MSFSGREQTTIHDSKTSAPPAYHVRASETTASQGPAADHQRETSSLIIRYKFQKRIIIQVFLLVSTSQRIHIVFNAVNSLYETHY